MTNDKQLASRADPFWITLGPDSTQIGARCATLNDALNAASAIAAAACPRERVYVLECKGYVERLEAPRKWVPV